MSRGWSSSPRCTWSSSVEQSGEGLFWGEALCDVLGGADFLAFGRVTTDGSAVISVLPVFGEPVHPQQFTIEQLGTVVAAAGGDP